MLSAEIISPFSILQPYEFKAYPYYPQTPGNLTSWESETLNFLNSVGAAAYFQIATEKQKRKLDTLNRVGLIRKYQLTGEQSMNIAAARPYKDISTLLKSLAFTQLILSLREYFEVKIYPGENHIHAYIDFNNKTFPVIIVRHGENISLLPLLTNKLERVIILAETYHPEFNKLTIPARIGLDNELLKSLVFRLPDGTIEEV